MPIPDYQECMQPILEILSDRQSRRLRDLVEETANRFCLTEVENSEILPSGQSVIGNRVGWAKTYLKKAGLLVNQTRGIVQITEEGLKVLAQKPRKIDTEFLRRYESFREFLNQKFEVDSPRKIAEVPTTTPEESIVSAFSIIQKNLADELLEKIKACSPSFFERLVVDLLVGMGYGGSIADAGKAIGRPRDGGIDGIINEDKLGLDVVCIQAKRWERSVGRPEVQAFAGSMEGERARKGVLITTSDFTRDAEEYVKRTERKIVLINGRRLAELMIEHKIGVTIARSFEIKKMDLDYFEEEG